jgi:hypothetical protein
LSDLLADINYSVKEDVNKSFEDSPYNPGDDFEKFTWNEVESHDFSIPFDFAN